MSFTIIDIHRPVCVDQRQEIQALRHVVVLTQPLVRWNTSQTRPPTARNVGRALVIENTWSELGNRSRES